MWQHPHSGFRLPADVALESWSLKQWKAQKKGALIRVHKISFPFTGLCTKQVFFHKTLFLARCYNWLDEAMVLPVKHHASYSLASSYLNSGAVWLNHWMQFPITSLSHRSWNQALKFSSQNHRRVKNAKVSKEDSYISLNHLMGGRGWDRKESWHFYAHMASLSRGWTEKQQAIN